MKLLISLCFAVVMAGFVPTESDAQTQRRKPAPKAAVPPPVTDGSTPVVVSRADEFSETNQTLINGQMPQPTPTPVGAADPEELSREVAELRRQLAAARANRTSANPKPDVSPEEKRRILLLNLDILTRAEQRAESLQKQLFELSEKENQMKAQISDLQFQSRSDVIERNVAMAGSTRPEEVRDARRASLAQQIANAQQLIGEIENRRRSLSEAARRADELVEKLRRVIEEEIDESLR